MNKRILIGLLAVLILAIVLPLTVGAEGISYDSSSVHPVTRQELAAFLVSNPVHNRTYDSIRYNCVDFAVDLWYDAYLAGIDAFIIILDKPGFDSHARVGFTAIGDDEAPDTDPGYTEYWVSGNGSWFYVEPRSIIPLTRMKETNPLDGQVIETIVGSGALQLYRAKHSGSPIPLIQRIAAVFKYKLGKLLR